MKSERGGIALNLTLIVLIAALCALGYMLWARQSSNNTAQGTNMSGEFNLSKQNKQSETYVFSDGLGTAESVKTDNPDETGAGVVKTEIFNIDLNNDKIPDRITKERHETGTAHFWDEYKIEINQNGRYKNITPDGFRTTVGAECALQKLQFKFKPKFQVIKISRPWRDSWDTPSMATRTVYTLKDNKMIAGTPEKMGTVCDVAELFKK